MAKTLRLQAFSCGQAESVARFRAMNLAFLAVTTLLAGGGLISLLVWLLILALVIYVVFLVIGMLPLPAPAKQIITVILAIIFLLVILGHLGVAL